MQWILKMRVLLLLALATGALAQWSAISDQVPCGAEIRVDLARKRTIKGTLEEVTDTGLTILRRGKPEVIERSDVARAYRLVPRSRAKSVLIATAIGAGAGLAIGAGMVKRGDLVGEFPIFTSAVGAGVGALSNYAFGKKKNEELIYSKY